MVRLIQRRLIIPRGDTGSFSIPALITPNDGNIAVFSIIDLKTQTNIFQKEVSPSNDTVTIEFEHKDTVNLPVGKYVWDIKIYKNPEYATIDENEQVLINGEVVDSYYSAYNLPICEIRQTGDALLTSDLAPTSTLAPSQIEIVTTALNQMQNAVQETQTNVLHYPKIQNGNWYVWDAEQNKFVDTGYTAEGTSSNTIKNISFDPVGRLDIKFSDNTSKISENMPRAYIWFYPKLEIGGISTDTGENTSSTSEVGKARLRTSFFLPCGQSPKITTVFPETEGSSFIILYYDKNKEYVTSTEWQTSTYVIDTQYRYFKILIKINEVEDFNEYEWTPPKIITITEQDSVVNWVDILISKFIKYSWAWEDGV